MEKEFSLLLYPIEALTKFFHSLIDDEPKPNLHVGEVMCCWTYYATLRESVSIEQICLHTTKDPELLDIVEKAIIGADSQSQVLEDFLIKEGVQLPPVSETKPKSNPDDIPNGAKMTDDEIANFISMKIAYSITYCATSFTQCVRNDVASMFLRFQMELMEYGVLLKSVIKKRGWLKIPPDYLPPGKPGN
jgi:Protein of unknown function (DUF3231)